MFILVMEVSMQKWPYADIGYINVEHFRSTPKKNDPAQKREYLTVEAVFGSENAVMFYSTQMSNPQKFTRLPNSVALWIIFKFLFGMDGETASVHCLVKSRYDPQRMIVCFD